jgi:uncharacterized RDD family membrane protein YckC
VKVPAGWHPDPLPPAPGRPAQLRYWDGNQWTEHTSPLQPVHQAGYGGAYAGRAAATTPDGVPLAGWWHRVGAYVLDSLIQLPILLLVTFPWVREVFDVYRDYLDTVTDDAAAGRTSTVSTWELSEQVAGPMWKIALVGLGLSFVYHVGFLMWRQATPGKLMTGLRVRLRETPGPMSLGTVVVRWLGQFGVGVLGLVPVVGTLTSLYNLLDALWPLWDGNKQAIHDKLAKTNVVRVR